MARAAKEELQIQESDVVADGGYVKSQDIKDCQDTGMEPHLPAVQNSPSERAGLYGKADFHYDPARAVYHCPAGVELTLRRADGRQRKNPLELRQRKSLRRLSAQKPLHPGRSPHDQPVGT